MRYTVRKPADPGQLWWEISDNKEGPNIGRSIAYAFTEKDALLIAALLNLDEEKNYKLEQERRVGLSRNAETP